MAGRFDASPTTELIPLGGCDPFLIAELADVLGPTGISNRHCVSEHRPMTNSYGTGIAASGSKDAPSVGQSTAVIPSGACSRSRRTLSAEDEQRQGRSVLAHDHCAPVHRLYMHRLERLHGAIASVGAYPGELTAILDLAAGRRSSSRPEVITNALACPPFEPTADSSGLDGS